MIIAIGLLASAAQAGPAPAPASRYTGLDGCRDYGLRAQSEAVAYRCPGLGPVPIWLAYADSSTSRLGFGPRPNVSGIFGLDRKARWKVEWRGQTGAGGFEPFAAIVRVSRPSELGAGELVVYRLRRDGASCIIADGLRSNAAAREAADRSLACFSCREEPNRF